MKKILLLATIFLLTFKIHSQDNKSAIRSAIEFPENVEAALTEKEKTMINEVYQSKAQEIVYNQENYLKDIKHLLRNRILIYEDANAKTQKKCKLLSEVPLLDTYNTNLKHDTKFDLSSFNPLKYQLDFFANGTYVYRIDNTNYFIQITSQYRKKS
jgi:hypothetical protein